MQILKTISANFKKSISKAQNAKKKETDTIHVSQCVTMLKNSRFARLIAAPNFLMYFKFSRRG